jgi:hypothetical protein
MNLNILMVFLFSISLNLLFGKTHTVEGRTLFVKPLKPQALVFNAFRLIVFHPISACQKKLKSIIIRL